MTHVQYRTGRRTVRGVEVCEYFDLEKPTEKVRVVAHAVGMHNAQVICNKLNQSDKTRSLDETVPLSGGF